MDNMPTLADMDEFNALPTTLETVHMEVLAMREDFAKILTMVGEIKETVGPALEGLQKSPIGKMLGI